jgi:RNA polymerase sigma factor, sigma-70 family
VEQMVSFIQMLNCAKKREVDAIALLYQHFFPGMFFYICNRVPDRDTAEDLTSDIFLQMVDKIDKVKATNEASFAAWIFRVAKCVVADYYHDHDKMPPYVSLDSIDDSVDCILDENKLEKQIYLSGVFSMLTEDQRVVLTGRIMMDYDAEIVGDIIGKDASAVRSLQYRALKSLRRLLSERKDYHAFIS